MKLGDCLSLKAVEGKSRRHNLTGKEAFSTLKARKFRMAMMETSKGICSRIANPVTVEEGLELSLNITPELLPEINSKDRRINLP